MSQLFADKVQIENAAAWPVIDVATEGFSGADLKRLVQDAKLQMAVDITRGRPVLAFEQYLQQASTTIRNSRAAYAQASQRAQEVNLDRPRWFNIHPELFEQPVPAVLPS